MPYDRDIL